jgi:hypothetical protein
MSLVASSTSTNAVVFCTSNTSFFSSALVKTTPNGAKVSESYSQVDLGVVLVLFRQPYATSTPSIDKSLHWSHSIRRHSSHLPLVEQTLGTSLGPCWLSAIPLILHLLIRFSARVYELIFDCVSRL